jgi:hypothetical protein
MGRARLTRIDAVREMAAAVDAFRHEVIAALEGLDMDIRRALEWIHGDRHEHWNGEVRRGWDRITQARIQLQQARAVRRIGDHEPACPDEKKALDKAKRRLETAQAKVEAVRQFRRAIDEAVNDYRGAKTPLASWLESDVYKALAALNRMMDNLESYVAMQAPSGAAAAPMPPAETATRGAAEERGGVQSTQYSVLSAGEKQSKSDVQTAAARGTEYSVRSTGPDQPCSDQPTTLSSSPGGPV